MSKISKSLVAISFLFFAAPAFAQSIATSEEIGLCAALKGKAADHSEWSTALEDFKTNEHISAKVLNKSAKLALNKIYEDIYSVRDLAGITEDSTILDQTERLLRRVKGNSLSIEEANDLMIAKLEQLDRAMFDTLQEAGQGLTNCKIFKGKARVATKKKYSESKSSDSNSSTSEPAVSSLVQ